MPKTPPGGRVGPQVNDYTRGHLENALPLIGVQFTDAFSRAKRKALFHNRSHPCFYERRESLRDVGSSNK